MTETELLGFLDDLRDDEFKRFKWFLEKEKVDNILPIKPKQLSKAEREETVDLMVQKYGFSGAVGVMETVFKKLNRNDLVENLKAVRSGAEDQSGGGTGMMPLDQLFDTQQDKEHSSGPGAAGNQDVPAGIQDVPAGNQDVPAGNQDVPAGIQDVPAGIQDVPADKTLMSVRTQFISGVSEPVLRKLLDKLLERGTVTDDEMEAAAGTPTRAEKARVVIDTVRRKGSGASSALIAALCEVDSCLSTQLNFM